MTLKFHLRLLGNNGSMDHLLPLISVLQSLFS